MELRVIPDFLPPPEELFRKDDSVKVTITLSQRSVDFFKAEALRHGTQYQRMIRRLLDAYVDVFDTTKAEQSRIGYRASKSRPSRSRKASR
jgi:hypothetical protein